MATPQKTNTSPLFTKSRPPSLVVDRFSHPVDETELRLAASVHLSTDHVDLEAIEAKLARNTRELRSAARAIAGTS